MKLRSKFSLFAFASFTCIACSSKDVYIIDLDGLAGLQIPVPSATPDARHTAVCGLDQATTTGSAEPSPVDGTWSGEMSDHSFPSGSKNVKMVLAHQSSGIVVGVVTLGDPSSAGLAFTEKIAYPVDAKDPPPPAPPYDGLSYTVMDGRLDGTQLSVGIDPREFWRPWCEFQDFVYDTPSGVACSFDLPLSDRIFDPAGTSLCVSEERAVPCNQLALCVLQKGFRPVVSGVCDCTNIGCSVCLPPKAVPLTFHLALQGDTLIGSIEAVDNASMGFLAETIDGKALTLKRQ